MNQIPLKQQMFIDWFTGYASDFWLPDIDFDWDDWNAIITAQIEIDIRDVNHFTSDYDFIEKIAHSIIENDSLIDGWNTWTITLGELQDYCRDLGYQELIENIDEIIAHINTAIKIIDPSYA